MMMIKLLAELESSRLKRHTSSQECLIVVDDATNHRVPLSLIASLISHGIEWSCEIWS